MVVRTVTSIDPNRTARSKARRSALLRLYPVMADARFRLFWLGMLPTTLSWQLSVVAAPYAAFVLANSATVLGVVSLAGGLPMLVFGLIGGVAADRLPRRKVLIVIQTLLGLAAAQVAFFSLLGQLEVWHLLVFAVLQGISFSFNMPTRQAYLADLVPRSLLQNAVALNNAGINVCRIAGPALAGILLATPGIGVGGVFVTMIGMHAAGILTLLRLPDDSRRAAEAGARATSSWAQLVEGLTHIARSAPLRALLGSATLVVLFGMPYQALMPLFAERVFETGAVGLGTLMTATGLGALAGSLAVAALSSFPDPARLQLACGVGFGISLVAFGLAPTFLLATLALGLVGGLSSAYIAVNNTLIMENTEPRFYGRVMSVYLLTFATMPLGALPAAWLADQVGGRLTVVVCGVLVVVVLAALALLARLNRQGEREAAGSSLS
jgi:MFS family permease